MLFTEEKKNKIEDKNMKQFFDWYYQTLPVITWIIAICGVIIFAGLITLIISERNRKKKKKKYIIEDKITIIDNPNVKIISEKDFHEEQEELKTLQCFGDYESVHDSDCQICEGKKQCPFDRYRDPLTKLERIITIIVCILMIGLIGYSLYELGKYLLNLIGI